MPSSRYVQRSRTSAAGRNRSLALFSTQAGSFRSSSACAGIPTGRSADEVVMRVEVAIERVEDLGVHGLVELPREELRSGDERGQVVAA